MKPAVFFVSAIVAIALSWSPIHAQTQEEFFQDDSLHELRLAMSARDWQTLKATADQDTYYSADLTWNGITLRNVGVRSRGNTTRNGIKPGLRVDLNRYLSDPQFLGLRAFALDNTYSDPSGVRESVTMKMFARMGLPAPREAHARVYVNNEYAGVYAVIESIDRSFIQRAFGTAEADVERGGYLYEYQWFGPYGFDDLGSALEPYARLFTPKTRETDSKIALYGPLRSLVESINSGAPDDLRSTGALLDVPEFLKYLAIENFMSEVDGLVGEWSLHNFYLYRFRDGKPAQLIPWDKDSAFADAQHPIDYHLDINVLVARAMAIPELRQIYLDTLLACADMADQPDVSDPRGWLEREVSRQLAQVRDAVADDPVYPFSLSQFDEEADRMTEFARVRAAFVRCQMMACSSE